MPSGRRGSEQSETGREDVSVSGPKKRELHPVPEEDRRESKKRRIAPIPVTMPNEGDNAIAGDGNTPMAAAPGQR